MGQSKRNKGGQSKGNRGETYKGDQAEKSKGQQTEKYYKDAGRRTTFLTPLEVEVLVCDAARGDEKATQELLNHFRPLIRRTAAKYSQVGFDEAVQEGYVAMLKAIQTYDASLGIPFIGFLTAKLRGDVRTAMRKLWRYNERVEYPSVQSGEDGRTDNDLWDQLAGGAYGAGGYGGGGGSFGGYGGSGGSFGGAGYGCGEASGAGPAELSDDAYGSYADVEFRMLLEGVTLSPRERLAIAGTLSGFSCSELAELHGVDVETVKTWRKRAFQKLRVALKEDDDVATWH